MITEQIKKIKRFYLLIEINLNHVQVSHNHPEENFEL